jgi:hypothetical protein
MAKTEDAIKLKEFASGEFKYYQNFDKITRDETNWNDPLKSIGNS